MDPASIFHRYIEKIKNINVDLLQFLDNDDSSNQDFQNLIKSIYDLNIKESKEEFYIILNLFSKISSNHYRSKCFFSKIESIIKVFKNDIKLVFTNSEIFDIFKYNRRILLFLFEEKILIPDEQIALYIQTKYPACVDPDYLYGSYFYPEFQSYFKNHYIPNQYINNSSEFYINRRNGENNKYICQLIQKDLVKEFIMFINQSQCPIFEVKIEPLVYETNDFLLNKTPNLMEYAAFYGSIQIFNYLLMNGFELSGSLWPFAIHSNNAEIIRILEENHIQPNEKSYNKCIKESIKCHYNDIADYILENYENIEQDEILFEAIESYNFIKIYDIINSDSFDLFDWSIFDEKTSLNETSIFHSFCKHGYYTIVEFLVKYAKIDINIITNEKGFKTTALSYAIQNQNLNMAQLLISSDLIDVNCNSKKPYYYDVTSLYMAVYNNNYEIVKLLLGKSHINVNSESNLYDEMRKDYALNVAIKNNNINLVKLLLNAPNIDINCKSSDFTKSETSLNIAVKNNNAEIVRLLLNMPNIDVNQYSTFKINDLEYNQTCLYMALRNDNIEMFKLLLSHSDIDVNLKSYVKNKEETILKIAVEKENIDIIKLLLSHPKIDVNQPIDENFEGETELNLAIRKGNIDIVKLLLSHPKIKINSKSIINQRQESALSIALNQENIEIFNLLISHPDIDVNNIPRKGINGETLLNIAIKKENIDIIKLLLSKTNIDVNGISVHNNLIKEPALNNAIKSNNIEIVKLLLNHSDIDINSKFKFDINNEYYEEEPALITALKTKNNQIIKLILEHPNIDINCKSIKYHEEETALNFAIENNDDEIVKILLSKPNIDVNCISIRKNKVETPLSLSCKLGLIDIVNILLSFPNIDINYLPKKEKGKTLLPSGYYSQDQNYHRYEGETPLSASITNERIDIIKILLSQKNIDVNCKSIYFDSGISEKAPLHRAIELQNTEIVQILLSRSEINVNLLSIFNENYKLLEEKYVENAPIHLAVITNNISILNLLLSHPFIDINMKSYFYIYKDWKKISHERTAFHMAIENKNIDIVKILLSNPYINIYCKSINGYENYHLLNHYEPYQLNNEIFMAREPKDLHGKKEFITPFYIANENKDSNILSLLSSNNISKYRGYNEFFEMKSYFCYKDTIGFRYYSNKTILWDSELSN